MTILPPAVDFTDSGITELDFKNAITDMREYLNDMFGDDSESDPTNSIITWNHFL